MSHKLSDIRDQVYVAFDVETGGPGFKYPVIAVGVCYGNKINYKKKRWCLDFDISDFDKTCFDEFWSKNLNVLETIKKESVSQRQGWKEISNFLTELEQKYSNCDIIICSDNPSFDLTFIDYNLYKYCDRLGVRYSDSGKYRRVMNPVEQRKYHPMKDRLKQILQNLGIKHTHYPEDDAECIYLQQILLENIEIMTDVNNLPILLV